MLLRFTKALEPLLDETASDPTIQRLLTEMETEHILPAAILKMNEYRPQVKRILKRLDHIAAKNQVPCIQEAAKALAQRFIVAGTLRVVVSSAEIDAVLHAHCRLS